MEEIQTRADALINRFLGSSQDMGRLHLPVILSVVGAISCATARHNPPRLQSSLPLVSSQAFTAVIDPRFVHFPNSWTPSEEDVLLAEPKVQACVLKERGHLRSTLPLFVRHYQGWTADGRRTLRVQFFDTRIFKELGEAREVVHGDGQAYFVVTFDLAAERCSF